MNGEEPSCKRQHPVISKGRAMGGRSRTWDANHLLGMGFFQISEWIGAIEVFEWSICMHMLHFILGECDCYMFVVTPFL